MYQAVAVPQSAKPIPLRTSDIKEAWQRLANLLATPLKDPADEKRGVLLRTVIQKWREGVPDSHERLLMKFFADVPLTELSRDACFAFWDMRKETIGERTQRPAAISTIRTELRWLGTMVNRYCRHHKITPVPNIHLPPRQQLTDFITVAGVRRLLESAYNGSIWDAATGDWRRAADGTLERMPDAWLREVWPMRRFITLLINTSSRTATIERALWSKTPNHPWIDFRVDLFRRSGSGEAETKKRRTDVRLLPAMMDLAAGWRDDDQALGIDRVIHRIDGGAVGQRVFLLFAMVREAAGLPGIVFRTLRASSGVYLMEAGCTPEEAAERLANSPRVLSGFYDRYIPKFSWAAADALDSRSYAPNKRRCGKKGVGKTDGPATGANVSLQIAKPASRDR